MPKAKGRAIDLSKPVSDVQVNAKLFLRWLYKERLLEPRGDGPEAIINRYLAAREKEDGKTASEE